MSCPSAAHDGPRILREKRTVRYMVELFCKGHHHEIYAGGKLCNECRELLAYAHQRLSYCRFGEGKTTCSKCPIHCYKPEKRKQIKLVMAYSGPRLILKHPLLVLFHAVDGLQTKPKINGKY